MEFIRKFIDVEGHVGSGEQPVYLMDVVPGEQYHTPHSSLLGDDIEWVLTRVGDKVRIPIFAYRTNGTFDTSLWGLGIQCGMHALDDWRIIASEWRPKNVILVLGDQAHEFEDGYRIYLGLTIVGDKDG